MMKIFIETSTQILRNIGTDREKDAIDKVLLSKEVEALSTSTVVYREYLATIGADIMAIREFIRKEYLEKNQGFIRMPEVQRNFPITGKKSKRIARLWKIMAMLNEKFGNDRLETKQVIDIIDQMLRRIIGPGFFKISRELSLHGAGKMRGEVQCLVPEPVTKREENNGGGGCTVAVIAMPNIRCCAKGSSVCRVGEVLKEQRNHDRIKKIIREVKKEENRKSKFGQKNKEMIGFLAEMEGEAEGDDIEVKIERRCGVVFSDVLIALQVEDDEYILTADADYEVIFRLMGTGASVVGIWKKRSTVKNDRL